MRTSTENLVKSEVLKNLLLAQKRAAESVDIDGCIKLAKFIDSFLCRESYQGVICIPTDVNTERAQSETVETATAEP